MINEGKVIKDHPPDMWRIVFKNQVDKRR